MLSGRRMPSSSANFSAGMILPRAMPAMSGMMASTSEMPWSRRNWRISFAMGIFLTTFVAVDAPPCRTRRTARFENGLLITFHSGCHCTASAKLGADFTRNASTSPSGARASTARSGAEPVHALPVQRVHADALLPGELAQQPIRARAPRRAPARTARRAAVPCPRGDRRGPATSCTRWCSVPPIATFISWNPRHTPNTGTPVATARGISDSVVASRCGSCSVPGALAGPAYRMRLDVRRTAGKEDAIDARQDLGDVERRLEHRDQQRQAVRGLHDGRDVFLADGMKWMRTDHASIGGNADDGSACS